MKPQPHPVLLGIAAALVGSLLSAFLLTLFGFTGELKTVGQVVGGTLAVGGYGFILAIPVVLLYGMPLYALLRKINFANPVTALLVGAAPGVAEVLWTHGSWLDAILWHGVLIALFYLALRRRYATP
ncbi:hypothetical protein [Uliginosibacterium sp. TH139]|uniref:hypothetical protein n=1 Tax=Uliginosibacterium sp. TH139 TaxID=2067453 RepID=UPI001180357F|nr:hypothetical protein [Uliginosibacterium sp. TH139]